jgi:hypothetical protein
VLALLIPATGRILGASAAVLTLIAIAIPSSAAADTAEPLFDPMAMAQVDFTLSPTARADLDANPDEYVPADLQIHSAAGDYDDTVGLRLKGTTSFRTLDGKAAFKVKFKEFGGAKFAGLKKLTLNNLVQDDSMLHETLVYEIYRAVGVPAPRTGFAYVTVDGDDYGVYLNVETMDDVSLARWFTSTSHLYEAGNHVDVRTADLGDYEVDEGDEGDLSDLEALIAAVDATGSSFTDRMTAVADLDEMVREWAVEKYAGAWDNYTTNEDNRGPNNYYLHSDASGTFSMIPWGADSALWAGLPLDGPGGRMFESCRADSACYDLFRADLATLPDTVTSLGLEGQAQTIAAMLEPWQQADPRREQTMEEIAEGVSDVREFLRLRPADLCDQAYWVDGPPLPCATTPDGGGDPPPSDPVDQAGDTDAPETTLTRTPASTVHAAKRHVTSRFRFESSETDPTFECRLDDRKWRACNSPHRVRVGLGHHVFRVRAVDAAGNVDATPERYRWSVTASA